MRSMSNKTKWILTGTFAGIIVILAVVMVVILIRQGSGEEEKPYYEELVLEAGTEFNPTLFLKNPQGKVTVTEDSQYDISKVGAYKITLLLEDNVKVQVLLRVKDSVPPKFRQEYPMLLKKGSSVPAKDLLVKEQIEDATAVKVTYLSEINTEKEGLGYVSARLEDEGGNVTKVDVQYFVTDGINDAYFYEIGSKIPETSEFLPGQNAVYAESPTMITAPGYGLFKLKVFGSEYLYRYKGKDTIPPKATVVTNIPTFFVNDTLPDPKTFFEKVEDATAVTVSYKEQYVLNKAEARVIQIVLKDLGENVTVLDVPISVYDRNEGKDTEPPTFEGLKDIQTYYGLAPDYLKGIRVYDGRDGNISLDKVRVDDSKVHLDLLTEGTRGYPVTYIVKDAAGNETSETVFVTVVEPSVKTEDVSELLSKIMGELHLEGLSRFTRIEKIYDYITENYKLSGDYAATGSGDLLAEAYIGFTEKRGNNRTYVAMMTVLLEKEGIESRPIHRKTVGTTEHHWLMVDYGIGWLHVDPTPIPGYLWTKDNHIVKEGEASPAECRKRVALTDGDLKTFTSLSNQVTYGWNYYKAEGEYPESATKDHQGYHSPSYNVIYSVENSYQGHIEGKGTQKIVHGKQGEEVTAVPHIGFRFVGWSDGVTVPTRKDTAKDSFEVYAIFEIDEDSLMYHKVEYKAGEGGTIEGKALQDHVHTGSFTSFVKAVPNPGYYFVSWSDGNKTPERSDLVRGDMEVEALFAKCITILYQSGEGGQIVGAKNQILKPGERTKSVTAIPSAGYTFVGWSDGVKNAFRSDIAEKDMKVIAIFIMEEAPQVENIPETEEVLPNNKEKQ